MKTLKIEKEVTKEDVYVFTQCEKDFQKVTEIITRSGESLIGKDDYFVTYSPLNGYWVTLDSIGDKHQITIPQLAELLGVEYPPKPKFQAGKWYIGDRSTNIFCHNGKFDEDGDRCGYGVVRSRSWVDANDVGWGGDYREATHSEVEKALIAEAKRRYEVGDRVSRAHCYNTGSMYGEDPWVYKGVDEWLLQDNNLFNENLCLMRDGKWAEVIEQKQLPTLEELIAEAKSKITVRPETYPCWVEGMREIKAYHIGGIRYPSEKSAIAAYIYKKIREEYL